RDPRVAPAHPPRGAPAECAARPPVVDLARRARWTPLPLGLRDARIHAERLPAVRANPAPADGNGPIISRVEGLHHRYETSPAVQGVSLTLRRGVRAALMGPTG